MQFKQLVSITTALKSPFTLTKVAISLAKPCTRKRFVCGYKAVEALRTMKLNPETFYGADVTDDNGVVVAELE